jgi:hypothetical protein
MTTAEFFKRTVIVLCVALVPLLIWFLFDVILIAVGAILIGVLQHLVAEPLIRWCRLPESLALVVSGILWRRRRRRILVRHANRSRVGRRCRSR